MLSEGCPAHPASLLLLILLIGIRISTLVCLGGSKKKQYPPLVSRSTEGMPVNIEIYREILLWDGASLKLLESLVQTALQSVLLSLTFRWHQYEARLLIHYKIHYKIRLFFS